MDGYGGMMPVGVGVDWSLLRGTDSLVFFLEYTFCTETQKNVILYIFIMTSTTAGNEKCLKKAT